MSEITILALAMFLPAFLLAALLTPLARRVALAMNLVAPVRPDRLHREARPYGGGIAILVAAGVVIAAEWILLPEIEDESVGFHAPWMGRLALGAVLFFALGLLDDRFAFGGWLKLGLQTLIAAVVVVGLGQKATVWLWTPGLPEVVSILWILAVVNAYNMFDHADGLGAAAGAVALAALAAGQADVYSGSGHTTYVPAPALAVAGALAGSMLVGYLLAALTIEGQYFIQGYVETRYVVLVPLAVLAVPLFDMVCVILGRLWRRENPMKGDATSHLAHRMLARGWSPRGIVAFAAGATALTGGASVAMYHLAGPMLIGAWIVVAGALAAVFIARRPAPQEAAT
jgi:UDP-GlcNAc:undecaprenyl-phosphate GlcNAc-1-phosphate transferase